MTTDANVVASLNPGLSTRNLDSGIVNTSSRPSTHTASEWDTRSGVSRGMFGSGPVRGFAVVHCLGILTSMFSAVFFSRGLVNFWYGRQKKLKSVSIGTVWRPEADGAITKSK